MGRIRLHVFQCRGKYFAINPVNCVPFEIDEDAYAILSTLPPAPADIEDTIKEATGIARDVFDEVMASELFTDRTVSLREHCDHLRARRIEANKKHGALEAVLHLTDKCNIRCEYCYLCGKDDGTVMSADIAIASMRWLVDTAGAREFQKLVFFGGEPLLEFPTIQAVVDEWEKIKDNYRQRLYFAMTTNATLVTPDIAEYLARTGCRVTVSYDGYEAHDKYRRFPNGSGSAVQCLRGIEVLKQHGVHVDIRATVTNATDIEKLITEVKSLDLEGGLAISNASNSVSQAATNADDIAGSYADLTDVTVDLCLEGYRQAKAAAGMSDKEIVTEICGGTLGQKIKTPESYVFQRTYKRARTKEKMLFSCGAGDTIVGIDQRGRIYPCHRFIGLENGRYVIGDVRHGMDHAAQEALFRQFDNDSESCESCWALHLCGRGCLWERAKSDGSFVQLPQKVCDSYRQMFESMIWLTSDLSNHLPEAEDGTW